jgi:hypothetical protein
MSDNFVFQWSPSQGTTYSDNLSDVMAQERKKGSAVKGLAAPQRVEEEVEEAEPSWREQFSSMLSAYWGDDEVAKGTFTSPKQPMYDPEMEVYDEYAKAGERRTFDSSPTPDALKSDDRETVPTIDTRSNETLDKPPADAPDAKTPMPAPPEVKEEGLMSRPVAGSLTDDAMGLPDEPSQVESLKGLYATKGKAYKDSKIIKRSHVKEPIIEGGIRGKSRIGGDASIETQTEVINKIIQMGRNENMSEKDIGFMLAMSRVESGFNPDAAAGTTSASGIGQFIDTTGATYGINDTNRWDLESQVDALIGYTKFNKAKVIKDGRDQKELYKWMYKYHHDGPNSIEPTSTSLGWETATKKVNPLVDKYTDYVKSLDPLQGPELPERKSLGSIRPSARPETDLQVASN